MLFRLFSAVALLMASVGVFNFSELPIYASDCDRDLLMEAQFPEKQGLFHDLFPFFNPAAGPNGGPDLEPLGAEDRRSHKITPLIPEPMVFDLVRPLGEHRGAAEMNILGLIPMGGRRHSLEYVDPLGIVHVSNNPGHIEWAPEYEVAIRDGLAIEFEFPFEGDTLEALKTAGQWTIGTAFDDHYIHGIQVIVEPTVDFRNWNLVALYLGGYRFDERWSTLFMIGGRTAMGPEADHDRTEFLFNLTLFADIAEHITLGLESNFGHSTDGNSALLLTPQVHCELSDHFMIQTGVAVGFEPEGVSPFWVLRTIYSF
ncbi:MAG TPA: hypothetical protein VNQ76_15990 [Planctomicrobium sp.]|nr:hypothetical protein [Planctomicrobium sp.]